VYTDALCTSDDGGTGPTGLTLTTDDAGSATFYLVETQIGSMTMFVSSSETNPTVDSTFIGRVSPGRAAQVGFVTPVQSVAAGQCSAPATVQLRDAWGNASPPSGSLELALDSDTRLIGFYADVACTTPVN